MSKPIIFFIFYVISAAASAIREPNLRDVVDEATQELDQLKSLVQGDILVAHDNLDDFATAFETFANNAYNSGRLEFQQIAINYLYQFQAIRIMGEEAGVDIISCTENTEHILGTTLDGYLREMTLCISSFAIEALKITSDSRYYVDIIFNKIYELERQLQNCGDDVLCISPVLTQIELNKVKMPEDIKTEVASAENLLTALRTLVQDCSEDKVAAYAVEADIDISNIVKCVEELIG